MNELLQDNQLQFLDLRLILAKNHACWQYSPKSEKPVLNFKSAHSKVVKKRDRLLFLILILSKFTFSPGL